MMKLLTFFALLTFGLLFIFLASPVYAQNSPLRGACSDGTASGSAVCNDLNTNTNPITGEGGVVNTVARILTIITGIASVIMLILGGMAFITAGGNAESEAKAKRRVIYGVVGIAVAALAWTLISFIVARLL